MEIDDYLWVNTVTPRPLKMEWVLEHPYTISGGLVLPRYKVDRTALDVTRAIRYDPARRPELAQALARVCDEGELGILRFTDAYGLLGYDQLVMTGERRGGDPVDWIFAHARTVGLCLELTRLLMRPDKKGLEACLPVRDGLYDCPCAIRDVALDLGLGLPYGDIVDLARHVRRTLINSNIRGITPFIREIKGKEAAAFGFSALIEVIYQSLADVVTHGRAIRQCAADDCTALFMQMHRSQRFCAPIGKQTESPCARRMRARRQKQR